MSMTDPIADFLTRVRNASSAGHKFVDIPASNIKRQIADIMMDQGFILNYTNIKDEKQGLLRIYLKYDNEGVGVIKGLKRVSTPGLRNYKGVADLPRVRNNLGVAVISTSKGVMTAREATRQGVGGEVICYIW